MKLNRMEKAVLVGLIVSICLSFAAFADTCGDIDDSVLRLHILANSDSDSDQSIKLAVRDRLLSDAPELFAEASDRDAAVLAAKEQLDDIRLIVADELARLDADGRFTVEVVEDMYFEQREYDGFTMPAGNYAALRIVLGSGEGHNWWCVMYPPLCSASSCRVKDVFPAKQNKVLSTNGKYEVKFRLYEWFTDLFHRD